MHGTKRKAEKPIQTNLATKKIKSSPPPKEESSSESSGTSEEPTATEKVADLESSGEEESNDSDGDEGDQQVKPTVTEKVADVESSGKEESNDSDGDEGDQQMKPTVTEKVADLESSGEEESNDSDEGDQVKPTVTEKVADVGSSGKEESNDPGGDEGDQVKPTKIDLLKTIGMPEIPTKDQGPTKDASEVEEANSIYYQNVHFNIEETALMKAFGGQDIITNIKRLKKRNGTFNGRGIVTYKTPEQATKALEMDGKLVLGRAIHLSAWEKDPKKKKDKPIQKTRIYVGNLPKTTTESQIRKLFVDCGVIRDIKWGIPKGNGNFPGFGYINFTSNENAQKAALKDGVRWGGNILRVEIK